jgi:hypothetical protein
MGSFVWLSNTSPNLNNQILMIPTQLLSIFNPNIIHIIPTPLKEPCPQGSLNSHFILKI